MATGSLGPRRRSYALWVRSAIARNRTESEVPGQAIDFIRERSAVSEFLGITVLCFPEPLERQESEGHELRALVRITLFALRDQPNGWEIGLLVEVGIGSKVKRDFAVEVARSTRRPDDFFVQSLSTGARSPVGRFPPALWNPV
jgi:hypothetical protein